MIIPIFQPQGTSSHRLAQSIGQLFNTKATHTGTLDPMAQGVLVVLTDNSRFRKAQYSNWLKTYEFQVLLGFRTDSHDMLGLITKHYKIDSHDVSQFNQQAKNYLGPLSQTIPAFSAKRWQGKSLHDLAKGKEKIPTFKQDIHLHSLVVKNVKTLKSSEILQTTRNRINKVKGNFRQPEINDGWNKALSDNNNSYPLITIEAVTSSKTYIRGLVRDWSQQTGLAATTYHINRTQNGPWGLKNCLFTPY